MFESGILETALAFGDRCCVILPYLAKVAFLPFFAAGCSHIVMANAPGDLSTIFGSFSLCFLVRMNASLFT